MTNKKQERGRHYIGLQQSITDFEKLLLGSLQKSPLPLRPYLGHLANSLGKNLRGRALLIAASNEEELVDSDAVKLAVALELFHLATLVHDDIIDDAATRRGQESLHRKFGRKQAVLCGDYLFAQAIEISTDIDKNRSIDRFEFASYARLVCIGELRQGSNNFNFDLSVRRYLSIIRGKTAMLFEAALAGGAWILEDAENFEGYRKLGRYIGMIFQMMDDLIDIEQTQEKAKKPILSDLRTGVITLPLILSIREDGTLKGELLAQKRRESFDPVKIQQWIFRLGGEKKTRALADRYYHHALKELENLSLYEKKKEHLLTLLNKAAGR